MSILSEFNLTFPVLTQLCYLLGAALVLVLALSMLARAVDSTNHPFAGTLLTVRNLVVPTGVLLYFFSVSLDLPDTSRAVRVVQTAFWIEVLWVVTALIKDTFFTRAPDRTWRARMPDLFLDLLRLSVLLVGSSLVIANVWHQDLAAFLATLGVGSIVLGLALQDTLGNLMAGIALLFERPFGVGDWIQVGDVTGEVLEMNWRAVRLRTRSLDSVVVPNSTLGKERICNFSRPGRTHGVSLEVAFSYDDPPNKVRQVLQQVARSTSGILDMPVPSVRTKGYNDFSIGYQIWFFVDNFAELPEIEQRFMTQVWYAAKRNRLTIPFPIRTVYKTEVPPPRPLDADAELRGVLSGCALFSSLSQTELEVLSRDSLSQHFAAGERIVQQGAAGECMYLLRKGVVVVSISRDGTAESEVARLAAGDLFGEMSLLTGEARSASVTAIEDVEVVVIHKETLQELLNARPTLANELAEIVEMRQQSLSEARERAAHAAQSGQFKAPRSGAIVTRIRQFFGIDR